MANLTYSTSLPQRKALIKSQQLRTLFTDIRTFTNTFIPDVAGGAQYQSLLVNSGLNGFDLSHVLRADGAVNFSGVSSLAQGDVLYFDGTNITRLGAGSSGEVLSTNGAGANPSWISVSGAANVLTLTTSSTLAGNNIYLIDPSAGSITHNLPSTTSATMKPIKLIPDGVNSFEDNNWTLSGNGNNIIVLNADGSVEAAAATIDVTANVPMTVYCNGTQYIVMGGA